MEMQEQLSNDAIAMAIVSPASEVVGLTIDDIIDDVDVDVDGEATRSADPVPSITASNVTSSGSGSSGSPSTSKKVDRELRQPFPVKVYEMLENADEKQFSHIVSWNEVGTGFMVHNKDLFTKEIVPHYFNLTKYKSFQRQVSKTALIIDHILNLHWKLLFWIAVFYHSRSTSQSLTITIATVIYQTVLRVPILHYSCHSMASNE